MSEGKPDNPSDTPVDQFRNNLQSRSGAEDDPEDDLWQGGFSSRAMFGSWVLSGLITIGMIAAAVFKTDWWYIWVGVAVLPWLYFGAVLVYRKMSFKYKLTSQRFMHEAGLLKRTTDRIEVIDIDDVTFEQGFVERFVGVGSIKITSSDRSHPELWLRGIEKVKEISGLIDDVRRKERRRRGVHIEAI